MKGHWKLTSTMTTYTLARRSSLRLAPVLLIPLAVAALALACGSDGSQTPNPDQSPPSTVSPTVSPIVSPTVSPPPSPSVSPCAGDLASAPPATIIYGATAGDFLADRFSLASGDFNGDGIDDVLLGAPKADGPSETRLDSGEAYVILGRDSLPTIVDLAEPGSADVTILGETIGDNLGFTVAAGDVNGDGFDDILVGARFAAHQDRQLVGKTYIVFGRADLPTAVDTAEQKEDVAIVGKDPSDFSSTALATGDVNGDGNADIIIGASNSRGPDNDRQRAGEVYVVVGDSELPPLIDLEGQDPYFTVFGGAKLDALPSYIAAGDLDGDGRDELILGTRFATRGEPPRAEAGEAYIIAVPTAGRVLELASGEGFVSITGAQTRDHLGIYLAAADISGDGLDDAIIGTRDADGPDGPRLNAGAVHVVLGSRSLLGSLDLAEAPPDTTVIGADTADSLGLTVAAGDVDGDGIADILAAAPGGDGCQNARKDSGKVYIIRGDASLPAILDLGREQPAAAFFGVDEEDQMGLALATGDVNGDGRDDIIIGTLLANGPDNDRKGAGEAYIILGR